MPSECDAHFLTTKMITTQQAVADIVRGVRITRSSVYVDIAAPSINGRNDVNQALRNLADRIASGEINLWQT